MKKFLILLLISVSLNASHLKEKDYVNKYCDGIKEVILDDYTRVDCLTKEYAFEFDFAKKWYEAIGQSLYYAMKTNKEAGIYLIVNTLEDNKYVYRARQVCEKYNIKLVVIYDYDISQKLRNDFMKDLKLSRPLTLERYEERSKMIRFKEGLARLIAPML